MLMMCKSYELCNRMVVIMRVLNMQFIQLTVLLVKIFINVSLQLLLLCVNILKQAHAQLYSFFYKQIIVIRESLYGHSL